MQASTAGKRSPALANPRFQLILWLIAGAVGWAGVILVGQMLQASEPRALGFDLELVLEAGRRVASGASPYDANLVAGTVVLEAQDLFYSYPPPLAQAASILSGLPSITVLVAFGALAVAAFAVIVARLNRPSSVPAALAILPLGSGVRWKCRLPR